VQLKVTSGSDLSKLAFGWQPRRPVLKATRALSQLRFRIRANQPPARKRPVFSTQPRANARRLILDRERDTARALQQRRDVLTCRSSNPPPGQGNFAPSVRFCWRCFGYRPGWTHFIIGCARYRCLNRKIRYDRNDNAAWPLADRATAKVAATPEYGASEPAARGEASSGLDIASLPRPRNAFRRE